MLYTLHLLEHEIIMHLREESPSENFDLKAIVCILEYQFVCVVCSLVMNGHCMAYGIR